MKSGQSQLCPDSTSGGLTEPKTGTNFNLLETTRSPRQPLSTLPKTSRKALTKPPNGLLPNPMAHKVPPGRLEHCVALERRDALVLAGDGAGDGGVEGGPVGGVGGVGVE